MTQLESAVRNMASLAAICICLAVIFGLACGCYVLFTAVT